MAQVTRVQEGDERKEKDQRRENRTDHEEKDDVEGEDASESEQHQQREPAIQEVKKKRESDSMRCYYCSDTMKMSNHKLK